MGQELENPGERREWDTGQGTRLTSLAWSCLLREESTLNPGQGPPGLGDPGSLFLEGQDQQHGEHGSLDGWLGWEHSCLGLAESGQRPVGQL